MLTVQSIIWSLFRVLFPLKVKLLLLIHVLRIVMIVIRVPLAMVTIVALSTAHLLAIIRIIIGLPCVLNIIWSVCPAPVFIVLVKPLLPTVVVGVLPVAIVYRPVLVSVALAVHLVPVFADFIANETTSYVVLHWTLLKVWHLFVVCLVILSLTSIIIPLMTRLCVVFLALIFGKA